MINLPKNFRLNYVDTQFLRQILARFLFSEKSRQIQTRQIPAVFLFGENLIKSNEVKTKLTKEVLSKEKFVNFLRYKNLESKMRNQDHRGRG